MRVCPALLALSVVSVCALPAQSVLVVDVNQGPGSQFVDVQSAIDAASPGDRITVRSGLYEGFVVDKPLHIVGDPSFSVPHNGNVYGEWITIENLPAGTDTVLRGVSDAPPIILVARELVVRNCQGRILLDEITSSLSGASITDSAQVYMNRCGMGGTYIARSSVQMSASPHSGTVGINGTEAALTIEDSDVWVARSTIVGMDTAPGHALFPTGVAIVMSNSDLVLTDDGSNIVRGGMHGTGSPLTAIVGNGNVTVDPDVVFVGNPFGTGITSTVRDAPHVVATGAELGGTASVELQSNPGDTYFLILGDAGPALPLPSLGGELWLTLSKSAVVAGGVLDATGTVALDYPVPNFFLVIGHPTVWVGIAGDPAARFWLSNNAGVSYRP